jgi:hypothetical protein
MRSHFTIDHCILKVIRVYIDVSYIRLYIDVSYIGVYIDVSYTVDFVGKKIFL